VPNMEDQPVRRGGKISSESKRKTRELRGSPRAKKKERLGGAGTQECRGKEEVIFLRRSQEKGDKTSPTYEPIWGTVQGETKKGCNREGKQSNIMTGSVQKKCQRGSTGKKLSKSSAFIEGDYGIGERCRVGEVGRSVRSSNTKTDPPPPHF